MAFDKTNTGILSRNERKESDKHPDFTGQINVGGVDYWLSGWIKERNDGSGKFFSLAVKPKEAPRQAAPQRPAPAKQSAGFDDDMGDVPF